jgi:iron complex transport system permease protein
LNWYAFGVWGVWAGALAGAAFALVLVTGATSWHRDASALSLLLAGVAINSVCSALILLVLGLAGVAQTFSIARWLIGSLDAIDYRPLAAFVCAVTIVAGAIILRAKEWNLISVGEAWAGTRGAEVRQLLRFGFVSGSMLAALTVAVTGPIGFIGLVVPHLVRMRVSADDRVLMPCAFFLGGVLLAACDAIGRVLLTPAEIPAGAITACIGGPYLVWLVRQRA